MDQWHEATEIRSKGTRAGEGIYVSVDLHSSAILGDTLVQVEVDPGYKYLDLADKRVLEKLRAKGISYKDIRTLDPQVAIRDVREGFKSWWVLKTGKGVKVKPFSSQKIPLEVLERSYFKMEAINDDYENKQKSFLRIIRKDIQSRAKKDFSVLKSPLVGGIDDTTLRDIAHRHINDHLNKGTSLFKNATEAQSFLNGARYLSKADSAKIVHHSLSLFQTPADKLFFLIGQGWRMSDDEYTLARTKVLSLVTSEQELESMKALLTDEEYADASKKIQPRKQTSFSTTGMLEETIICIIKYSLTTPVK